MTAVTVIPVGIGVGNGGGVVEGTGDRVMTSPVASITAPRNGLLVVSVVEIVDPAGAVSGCPAASVNEIVPVAVPLSCNVRSTDAT